MLTMPTILKTVLILLAISVTATAAARRPSEKWHFYHFDGNTFVSGKPAEGEDFIAVGDKLQPLIANSTAKLKTVSLSSGKGAVAGIAYIQSSGGKLGNGAGYSGIPGLTLQALSDGKISATFETDEKGYFTANLNPGQYKVGSAPFYVDITVKEGITTIVPVRAGKRMVD